MSGERLIILQLSAIEVAQLVALAEQFTELLDDGAPADDPGMARLTPEAYPTDPQASAEFRRLTRDDLLGRRSDDVGRMLRSLLDAQGTSSLTELSDEEAVRPRLVALDAEDASAWMRTLTAIRLVFATRLGIEAEGDGDPDDPRMFLYEWLGSTLESVVQAATERS